VAVGLLVDDFLSLLLGLLQPGANPSQRLLGQHQAGSDDSLPRGDKTITTALLVFATVDIKDVVLDIACEAHRVAGSVVDAATDLLGIFTNDGEAGVDAGQALVSQRVGTL